MELQVLESWVKQSARVTASQAAPVEVMDTRAVLNQRQTIQFSRSEIVKSSGAFCS